MTEFERRVMATIAEVERGEVTTYGEIAELAGYPGLGRAVGGVLARHGDGLPWWRVVTRSGRLVPGNEDEHARRLRLEGVDVTAGKVRGLQPSGR